MSLDEYPGFGAFAPDLQALLSRVEAGEDGARPALLERVADALNVFIGLDLLQFVFMPSPEEDGSEPIEIDLIVPAESEAAAIAWFTVDEAGYDEFRDAVTLFGDVSDVLNPPIVLDVNDDEAEQGG
jgi:transcriptional regulator with XRE-family HTH domain